MAIFLVRHGDAISSSGCDEHRSLSTRGREETRALGRAIVARGLAFDRVVASPLVRAVQSAELIAAAIGFPGAIEIDASLEPEGDSSAAVARLSAIAGHVIAVSHEPIVRAIAARLSGQRSFAPFRTSTGCWLEGGRAVFTLAPENG